MRFSLDGTGEGEPTDLLAGVTDADAVQLDIGADDDPDPSTDAAEKVLALIDEAYAKGKPNTRIPCPFCGRPLRYRKDEHGRFAECPGDNDGAGGDFVCID